MPTSSCILALEKMRGWLRRRYRLIDLGGRPEVESSIEKLQAGENVGKSSAKRYFLLDRDNRPTKLKSSEFTIVRQLGRYCLENYLIDLDTIVEQLRSGRSGDNGVPITNPSAAEGRIKSLALSQVDQLAFSNVFSRMGINRQLLDISKFDFTDIVGGAHAAYKRMEDAFLPIKSKHEEVWVSEFLDEFQSIRK